MKPVVAIVGRPNVGKSMLFNKLTGKRLSIVEDTPGVTRDRIYGETDWNGRTFTIVDTGGIEPRADSEILEFMRRQAEIAIDNATVIIFLTDIRTGLTASDQEVANMLLRSGKPIVLAVNKICLLYTSDMEDFCPVQHPAAADDSDTITTHFEYHSMEANILKLDMLGHDDPTMVRMMQDLTGVDPHSIPLDDPDTMSIFTSSKVLGYENDEILGPTGAVAIPEFNTRFTRQMLVDTQPKDFNTLVRLSGFSHGTDVWLGNARELIVSGTASVLETVGCRDDIMLYLISKGLDPKMSFKIMEKVRKGKVKKGGFDEGWVEAMRDHDVPEWYIDSLAKIGYLFPKAHAVAYVMMAFRIAWFKVHEPLAFYATFFSVRAKAFDAEYCCAGKDAVKRKIREIENNKDATAVEQNLLTTLEVCYEFYLRGFHFDTINIYESDATKFKVTENGLLPPFTTVHGLGEAAAIDTVEKRDGKEFVSVEEFAMCCNKLSKTHIEQLKALGAFAGMAETSQMTLF